MVEVQKPIHEYTAEEKQKFLARRKQEMLSEQYQERGGLRSKGLSVNLALALDLDLNKVT